MDCFWIVSFCLNKMTSIHTCNKKKQLKTVINPFHSNNMGMARHTTDNSGKKLSSDKITTVCRVRCETKANKVELSDSTNPGNKS